MVGETHLDETANSACDLYKLIGEKMQTEKKEFNYMKYKEDTINNALKKHSSPHEALFDKYERTIFNMDAKIQSLVTENDALREMIDWDEEYDEDGDDFDVSPDAPVVRLGTLIQEKKEIK